LAFAAGLALATMLLGVAAALAGRTMTSLGGWARYAIAVVPLLMGLHLLGWVRLPILAGVKQSPRVGIGGAFVSGLLLSLVLVPCGTPLLASVMSYAAYEGSIGFGGLLLFLYGVGTGIPVLVAATAVGTLAANLDASGWRRRNDQGIGLLLLALGFYLLWKA
jgi:cytochrome c biogenesis protein CcdA